MFESKRRVLEFQGAHNKLMIGRIMHVFGLYCLALTLVMVTFWYLGNTGDLVPSSTCSWGNGMLASANRSLMALAID